MSKRSADQSFDQQLSSKRLCPGRQTINTYSFPNYRNPSLIYPYVRDGNLEAVNDWISHGGAIDALVMDMAAAYGHLDMVQLLDQYQQGGYAAASFSPQAINQAAGMGHYHTIKWLLDHQKAYFTRLAFERAVSSGYTDVVNLLRCYKERCLDFYHVNDTCGPGGHGPCSLVV